MDFMDRQAIEIAASIARRQLAKAGNMSAKQEFEVFITWKSKILENYKYLISTSVPSSGTFYELTYNGTTEEWYVDLYEKDNTAVIDWAKSEFTILGKAIDVKPGADPAKRHPTDEKKHGPSVYSRSGSISPAPMKEQKSRVERMFGKRDSWGIPESKDEDGNLKIPSPPPFQGAVENKFRRAGYKGFLLIRCPECGETRSFFAKDFIEETHCPCGCRIRLEDLIPAHVTCSKCGNYIKYRTNIKDDHEETVKCRKCDAPIDLQLNKNGTALTSIGNVRGGGSYVSSKTSRLPFRP